MRFRRHVLQPDREFTGTIKISFGDLLHGAPVLTGIEKHWREVELAEAKAAADAEEARRRPLLEKVARLELKLADAKLELFGHYDYSAQMQANIGMNQLNRGFPDLKCTILGGLLGGLLP